jgi:hypothetical protein
MREDGEPRILDESVKSHGLRVPETRPSLECFADLVTKDGDMFRHWVVTIAFRAQL